MRNAISTEASLEKVYALIKSGAGFTKCWAADVKEEESGRVAELGFFNRAPIYRLQLEKAAAAIP